MARAGRPRVEGAKRRGKTRQEQGRFTKPTEQALAQLIGRVPVGDDPSKGATALGRMAAWGCLEDGVKWDSSMTPEVLVLAGERYAALRAFCFAPVRLHSSTLSQFLPSLPGRVVGDEIAGKRREQYDRLWAVLVGRGSLVVREVEHVAVYDFDPIWFRNWQRHTMTHRHEATRRRLVDGLVALAMETGGMHYPVPSQSRIRSAKLW